jgi:hypothetical protein
MPYLKTAYKIRFMSSALVKDEKQSSIYRVVKKKNPKIDGETDFQSMLKKEADDH